MKNNEPAWMERLFQVFTDSVKWINLKSPIHEVFAYKCKMIEGVWEITISPWIHEFYGGKRDGGWFVPKYEMNLLSVADEFDTVKYIGFDSSKLQASIEGTIENSAVNITFHRMPAGTNPGRKINTFTNQITKIERK